MAASSKDNKLVAIAKQHPKVIEALLQAGYKARKCQDPQVYCRYAAVLHDSVKLVKQVIGTKHGHDQMYEIVAVIVDLSALMSAGDVGVNFVVEYDYGNKGHCMLEKMQVGNTMDLEHIEELFHRVFQAI